jgi:SAM-dependent methyltransferase
MRRAKSSKDAWTQRALAFWDQRQRRARPGVFTGYLQDESPACIGQRRFDGEWAQVQGWLAPFGKPSAKLRPGLRAGSRCLDVGCGTGAWLKALAGEFERVEGWDYAPAMVQASRRTLKAAGIRGAVLKCGQITERPGRGLFDLIFVGGVLMYTPDRALGPLLKAVARLLKPGGLLVLRESTCKGEAWIREGEPLRPGLLAGAGPTTAVDYVAVYRSPAELKARLQAAGLRVEAIRPNLNYKLSDMTEDWLRRLNRVLGGRLGRNRALAESVADWIYRCRALLLYPEYFVRHTLGLRPWKLENHWFLAKRP